MNHLHQNTKSTRCENNQQVRYVEPPAIKEGLRRVREAMESVVGNYVNLGADTFHVCGTTVLTQSVLLIAAKAFSRFYSSHITAFAEQFQALPFPVDDFITDIGTAFQKALSKFKPNRNAVFTTFLTTVITNQLIDSWKSHLRQARRNGWFLRYPLEEIAESLKRRIIRREKMRGSDFSVDHPPITVDDISPSELAKINKLYDSVFARQNRRTCFMLTTPPKDFRCEIEKRDAFALLEKTIIHDVGSKRRRARQKQLLYILHGLAEGKTEAVLADEMGKAESQIRRWIRDIEALASSIADTS